MFVWMNLLIHHKYLKSMMGSLSTGSITCYDNVSINLRVYWLIDIFIKRNRKEKYDIHIKDEIDNICISWRTYFVRSLYTNSWIIKSFSPCISINKNPILLVQNSNALWKSILCQVKLSPPTLQKVLKASTSWRLRKMVIDSAPFPEGYSRFLMKKY